MPEFLQNSLESVPGAALAKAWAESGFEALHQALLNLATAPTLQGVLQATIDSAVTLAGAEQGTISLKKDEATGAAGGVAHSYGLPGGGDLAQVEASGAAIPATVVPLTAGDYIIGTVRLRLPPAIDLDSRTEKLLLMLCEHAVLALDRTRRFEQLQRAKREWELTFDGMVDGVYICVDGVIIRANRALADMLSLKVTRILGQSRTDLYAHLPEYQVLRPWERMEHGPEDLDLQSTEFRFGSPERVFIETSFAPRAVSGLAWRPSGAPAAGGDTGGETPRRISIVREITEQRHLQEQLVQSEKLAALGELVSGVAHELNNPLTTVVGYAQLLEEDTGIPEKVQRRISMIHQESVRASRIVQNLLAFARRSEPQKAQLDINEVLSAILKMRAYQLQADNIEVIAEYGPDLPRVWGDPFQLQQVFLNIVNNAAQAVQHWRSAGTIRITTATAQINRAEGIRITVTDNGPGITPEHLRRVFDPFFTTKPTGQGTGLGMSISLGIISNHKGRIWAESRLGHGASFMVELPAAQEDEVNGTEESQPEALKNLGSACHILVVDDEEPVVTLITEILALDGHEVTPAFNGGEALALLQDQDFDLIISDVRMPAVGGPTFFEILQTTRPDLLPRVVFVTGDTVSRSTQSFLQKAGRPVLTKPFDPEHLRALVTANLPHGCGT